MKTFREYTDVVNPAYAVGGASIGPGMGQYLPTADLNLRAQRNKNKRQMLGPKQTVGDQHKKPIKKSDLDQLEKYLDLDARNKSIEYNYNRTIKEYDVKLSVKEYKDLINELYSRD